MSRSPSRPPAGLTIPAACHAAALVLAALAVSAHVATNIASYGGMAGPYGVHVTVRLPQVIPGQAEIAVRPTAGAGAVRRVTVQPVFWQTGLAGAPPPEEASVVPGTQRLYSATVWLMTSGAYSMRIGVEGSAGNGSVMVPVGAVATARLGMDRSMAALLAVLGLVLAVGIVSIIRAAAGESVLQPGAVPDRASSRAGRLAAAVAVAVIALGALGAARWWKSVDRAFARGLYRPLAVRTTVRTEPTGRVLRLTVEDSAWRARVVTPLVPDHGKLMHMFVVKSGSLDALAHLHPVPLDSNDTFETRLPPDLPSGRYRVYGDVVHESGFARTLVDSVTIPADTPSGAAQHWSRADTDDAAFVVGPGTKIDARTSVLTDGSVMTWVHDTGALIAGREADLRFAVLAPNGSPAVLEPYMGMAGHAMVSTPDGSVFVHLHPMGTVAMASQALFERRTQVDSLRRGAGAAVADSAFRAGAAHAMYDGSSGEVRFPLAFPKPGPYRVWVQVKRDGRVQTGVFDVDVK